MTTRPVKKRILTGTTGQSNLAPRRPVAISRRKPQARYLRRIARKLKALRNLNRVGLGFPLTPHRDELVRAWTVSYFLPMLKVREMARAERECAVEIPEEESVAENTGLRRIPRPRKGLLLPRLFAPCKKFEHSR